VEKESSGNGGGIARTVEKESSGNGGGVARTMKVAFEIEFIKTPDVIIDNHQ
jgi:hypothetical protein